MPISSSTGKGCVVGGSVAIYNHKSERLYPPCADKAASADKDAVSTNKRSAHQGEEGTGALLDGHVRVAVSRSENYVRERVAWLDPLIDEVQPSERVVKLTLLLLLRIQDEHLRSSDSKAACNQLPFHHKTLLLELELLR